MKLRTIIVHGWADNPQIGWMSWLAQELEVRGYEVVAPQFPKTALDQVDLPAILSQLRAAVGELQSDDIFVGHSMGVSLILRILMNAPPEVRIRGLVLVAGLASSPLYRPNLLFDPPLDFARIARMAKRRIVIHSDNDHVVPPHHSQELAKLLQAEIRIDPGRGHFLGLRGLNKLPSALDAVLEC
jgi:predicted alpha/beta hydrolase family esterase